MKTMNLTKTFGLAFMATALLFSSCKKDDDDDKTPPVVTCKLAKSVYFDQNSARIDSALYTYTGDKITKATAPEYNFTYEYSGDRVSKRSFFETGETTPGFYQQYTYNTDGTLSKIETYAPFSGTNLQLYDRMDFIYNAGKIQKIEIINVSTGTSIKTADFVYTYTGNNVTTVVSTTYNATPVTTTFTFSYDSNNNYIKKQNAQIYLLDPFFTPNYHIDPTFLPFALSANNVVSFSSGGTPIPFAYSLNDKQDLKDIKLASKSFIEYAYQCQ
jgi:hypothetical protein